MITSVQPLDACAALSASVEPERAHYPLPMERLRPHRAFTMIELLVVISIIALLAGMLMPVINLTNRMSRMRNTENLLRKVETALNAFRKEVRVYPFAAAPATDAGPWGNDLGYRLAHDLTATERDNLDADLKAASGAYLNTGGAFIKETDIDQPAYGFASGSTFNNQAISLGDPNCDKFRWFSDAHCAAINRVASERATVGVLSGNVGITRTVPGGGTPPQPWKDGSALLSAPKSRGYCADYLSSDLSKREISYVTSAGVQVPEQILDQYGQAVVYLNPVLNGVSAFTQQDNGGGAYETGKLMVVKPFWYKLDARGRTPTTALASSCRTTAALAYVLSYELWSAGPDRLFDGQRDSIVNRDNISITRYLKGLR